MKRKLEDKRLPQFNEGDSIVINNGRVVEFICWESLHGNVVMWLKNETGVPVGYCGRNIKLLFGEPFDPSPIEKDLWRDKFIECLMFDNATSSSEILSTVSKFINDSKQKKIIHQTLHVSSDVMSALIFVANETTQFEAETYFNEKLSGLKN